jgi:DMATS type aromatic prenyltransferase
MGGGASCLREYIDDQLRMLCDAVGVAPAGPRAGLRALLDPVGARPLAEPVLWPTDISDDHTPVEFSVACEPGKRPTLRILGERLAPRPGRAANLRAALELVDTLAGRLDLPLDRFHQVRQVFLDGEPRSDFGVWFSLVFRHTGLLEPKVYFNPDARGRDVAPGLVAEALDRLGLYGAYRTTLAHGVRPRQLNDLDRFSFFALDLHDRPYARVKLYVAHYDADSDNLVRAAKAVPGVDETAVRDLLRLTGCTGPLTGRPAVSGYTFVNGDTDRPSGYSLYLPIRDYVDDDEQARRAVFAVLDRFGLDTEVIDRAIDAVARRPLDAGVGLIAHVSLRLTADGVPGATVYLSSEAYRVTPPRRHGLVPAQLGSESWR